MLNTGNERILIIAPHSDDEVLGCGGLIERACRLGNHVKVVIAALGETTFIHSGMKVTADIRKKELSDALSFLGCEDYEVLFEDKEGILDTIPQKQLVSKIDDILMSFKPSMVFIPYPSFHQDHKALFHACMASLRPQPHLNYKLIAMYEYPLIVWQYPRINNAGELFLDLSEKIDMKVEAMKMHVSQIRESQHLISPESIKKWAEKRGMENGSQYAEKYYILRAKLF
ncbi:PIG-L family deacetylase [Fictibacillus sp. WQ 8-8]|uniref:PIG-L deacetylase family protein n=1 Tax=Fictibacillus sp. WQ 8-8 TaxID=2938788 RepID=UPI00210B72FC|nr:PIG-L deacetylase family protein [Fictibacillus sp. WQ 8-8]MCQ6265564.1 PIG-L family deacetylase [Fictibacillus sp. WQ 8-8]